MKNNLFSAFWRKPVAPQIHNQKNQILIEETYSYTGFQQHNRALPYQKENSSSEQIEQTSQHNDNKKKSLSNDDKKLNLQILNKDDMFYILLFCMLYMLAFFLAPNQFYHPKN